MRKQLLALGAWVCLGLCGGCNMVADETGAKVYNSSCVACHGTGAGGAPKLGDKQNWRQRAEQGLSDLVNNAINGKGSMPAKGGNPTLSDQEISEAVYHMLKQAGVAIR